MSGKVIKMDRNGKRQKGARLSLRQVVKHNEALVERINYVNTELARLKTSHDRTLKFVGILAARDAKQQGRCVVTLEEIAMWGKGDGVEYLIDKEAGRIEVVPKMAPKEVPAEEETT